MRAGAAARFSGVERVDWIRWWDALDVFAARGDGFCVEKALRFARESRHPDALWLASLFPAHEAVTGALMYDRMLEQGEDPRALYFVCLLDDDTAAQGLLLRVAEMGYAPAQSRASDTAHIDKQQRFLYASRSDAQKDRLGIYLLGDCYLTGRGCEVDRGKARELIREAAELNSPPAMFAWGKIEFEGLDWQRFHWQVRAVDLGVSGDALWRDVAQLLPSFESCERGRILHTVAPALTRCRNSANLRIFGCRVESTAFQKVDRMLALHGEMLGRARRAIACWSSAGIRCGVVKDVRVLIAKLAWEEPWKWGEKRTETS
jgi:hypothetical protein